MSLADERPAEDADSRPPAGADTDPRTDPPEATGPGEPAGFDGSPTPRGGDPVGGQQDGSPDAEDPPAGPEGGNEEGRPGESGDDPSHPKPSKLSALLSGPRFALGAVVVALAAFLVPETISFVQDRYGPPLRSTVVLETLKGDDFSIATAHHIPPEEVLGRSTEVLAELAESDGAVAVGDLAATMVVEGRRSEDIVLIGMRARILESAAPIAGTLLHATPQGAGEGIRVGFDLDSPDPIARTLDQGLGDPYFDVNFVTLERGEKVVFQMEAFADQNTYVWDVEIIYELAGRREAIVVQPDSGPFRLTSYATSYDTVYAADVGDQGFAFYERDPATFCAERSPLC